MAQNFELKLTDDEIVKIKMYESYVLPHDIVHLHVTTATGTSLFLTPDGTGYIEWRQMAESDLPEHDILSLHGTTQTATNLFIAPDGTGDIELRELLESDLPSHDILSLHETTETDTSRVFRPDGLGGVAWGEPSPVAAHEIDGILHTTTATDVELVLRPDGAGGVEWQPGSFITDGTENLAVDMIHTAWSDGLSNEEIYRTQLEPTEQLTTLRVETQLKGGGTEPGLILEIYDSTAGSVLMSASGGTVTTGSVTSGTGNLILIRLSNSSGSWQEANIIVRGYVA